MTDRILDAVALVFPGQGAQRPGMGQPWTETESWAQVAALGRITGYDLDELLLRADATTLKRTDHAQVATFALELVILAELERAGFPMRTVVGCAGHSLGEYAALVASGVLTTGDAARLVSIRAGAVLAAALRQPGTMAVIVNLDSDSAMAQVERAHASGADVWTASVNAAQQITVAGSAEGLAQLEVRVRELGGKLLELRVGGAFHSPFMAPAVSPVAECFAATSVGVGWCPLVTNVDGLAKTGVVEWGELACGQLVRPVQWYRTMRTLCRDLGARIYLEIGPGKALCGLIRLFDRELMAIPVNSPKDISEVVARCSDATL
ncbi:ACP S-malonyltransferase [Nocardia sp. CA-135953]|uniref:ACP S-malonyltransferase n=1 Tax=Nocardia sp. CA-135953 TaxID=3239978 RepID=UPI003D97393A